MREFLIKILGGLMIMCVFTSCSAQKTEEHHLIYTENVTYDKFGNKVSLSDEVYYIGKLIIDRGAKKFDFIKIESAPNYATVSIETKIAEWKTSGRIYDIDVDKYYAIENSDSFDILLKVLIGGHIDEIDAKIGTVYFNKNQSLDKSGELKQSILYKPIEESDQNDEYDIAYIKDIGVNPNTNQRTVLSNDVYYVGKIILNRAKRSIVVQSVSAAPEYIKNDFNTIFDDWENRKYIQNLGNGKYKIIADEQLVGSRFFTTFLVDLRRGHLTLIKPNVAEDYFNEKISKSQGAELRNAVITSSELRKIQATK